jgi:hexosaminidase
MTQFKSLPAQKFENVLGIEATMWTEWVPNSRRLEWQLFPRLIAVAETGWTLKSLKDYADFHDRLGIYLKRLDILGVNYAKLNTVNPKKIKRILNLLRLKFLDTNGGL